MCFKHVHKLNISQTCKPYLLPSLIPNTKNAERSCLIKYAETLTGADRSSPFVKSLTNPQHFQYAKSTCSCISATKGISALQREMVFLVVLLYLHQGLHRQFGIPSHWDRLWVSYHPDFLEVEIWELLKFR